MHCGRWDSGRYLYVPKIVVIESRLAMCLEPKQSLISRATHNLVNPTQVPVCIVGYREVTGHWPDLSNVEDLQKLGAEAFAFVNFARFAVPLRIGLALSTTPWIDENIVKRFTKKGKDSPASLNEE